MASRLRQGPRGLVGVYDRAMFGISPRALAAAFGCLAPAVLLLAACSASDDAGARPSATGTAEPSAGTAARPSTSSPTAAAAPEAARDGEPPHGLALPFDAGDIDGFISPFGLYRHSKDHPDLGHGGIDIPLRQGAPLFAVADGVIVLVTPSIDHRPGSIVVVQIAEGERAGEGWVFLYEHIDLAAGLVEGSAVGRGQLIASNPIERNTGNNHLQLSYASNDLRFFSRLTCWVDQLDQPGRTALIERFDELRASDEFTRFWSTATNDEGTLAYRELLNVERFPGGAQLCYPQGTDVRVTE